MKTAKQLRRKNLTALRIARNKQSLLMKDVAKALGMTEGHLSVLETGKTSPTITTAHKLAKFYGTTIEELFPAA